MSAMRVRSLLLTMALASSCGASAAERDVMLVLDNSGSMRKNDPARLTAPAVQQFVERQAPGTRVGVILFAEHPRLTLPLTPVTPASRGDFLRALDGLDYAGRWTETAGGVERALYELRVNGRPYAERAIVLMTDGLIDTGTPQRDLELHEWLRESLTGQARDERVRIFGIAFTEQADYLLLQSLAVRTEAEYFRAPTPADISAVLSRIETVMLQPRRSGAPVASAPAPAPSYPAEVPADATPRSIEPAAVPAAPAAESAGRSWLGVVLTALGGLLALAALAIAAAFGWSRRETLFALLTRDERPARVGLDPQAVLYDVYDPSDIKRHEIGARPVVIGRVSGSDPAMDYIVVDERTVGRWHATIERRGQAFWIRDEGSVNGTFVNDQRITGEHPLKHGDMVRVHRHEFEFVIPELFDSDRTMVAPAGSPRRDAPAAEARN